MKKTSKNFQLNIFNKINSQNIEANLIEENNLIEKNKKTRKI
jgi:hypothetical protein